MQSHYEEFLAQGAQLWTVSSDDPEKLRALRDDNDLTFPILLDPENKISISYGLLNEDNPKVPHPTALVIDADGVIRYRRVDEDYRVRPSAQELLEALTGG